MCAVHALLVKDEKIFLILILTLIPFVTSKQSLTVNNRFFLPETEKI